MTDNTREVFDTLSASHQKVLTNMVVKGLNQTKSYMDAYPDTSEDAARADASRLLANANMKEAYAELKLELKERASVDFDWCVNELVEVVRSAKQEDKVDYNAIKGSVNEINKMLGHHSPEKQEITLDTNFVIETVKGK